MSVVCFACDYVNTEGNQNCDACGYLLVRDTSLLVDNDPGEIITCPRCDTTNKADSINCHQCGYYFSTHPFPADDRARPTFLVSPRILMNGSSQVTEETADGPGEPVDNDPGNVSLHLVVNRQDTIQLNGELEYIIGRADIQAGWEPAVDLTEFGGEPGGVSRRHARIFVEDGQPYIEDVGSLNGTYINTVRLITRVPQPLRDGDLLLFGRVLVELRINPLGG